MSQLNKTTLRGKRSSLKRKQYNDSVKEENNSSQVDDGEEEEVTMGNGINAPSTAVIVRKREKQTRNSGSKTNSIITTSPIITTDILRSIDTISSLGIDFKFPRRNGFLKEAIKIQIYKEWCANCRYKFVRYIDDQGPTFHDLKMVQSKWGRTVALGSDIVDILQPLAFFGGVVVKTWSVEPWDPILDYAVRLPKEAKDADTNLLLPFPFPIPSEDELLARPNQLCWLMDDGTYGRRSPGCNVIVGCKVLGPLYVYALSPLKAEDILYWDYTEMYWVQLRERQMMPLYIKMKQLVENGETHSSALSTLRREANPVGHYFVDWSNRGWDGKVDEECLLESAEKSKTIVINTWHCACGRPSVYFCINCHSSKCHPDPKCVKKSGL